MDLLGFEIDHFNVCVGFKEAAGAGDGREFCLGDAQDAMIASNLPDQAVTSHVFSSRLRFPMGGVSYHRKFQLTNFFCAGREKSMEKVVLWSEVEKVLNFRISVLKSKQDYEQAIGLESDLTFLSKKIVEKNEKRSTSKNEYSRINYFK